MYKLNTIFNKAWTLACKQTEVQKETQQHSTSAFNREILTGVHTSLYENSNTNLKPTDSTHSTTLWLNAYKEYPVQMQKSVAVPDSNRVRRKFSASYTGIRS